MGKILGIIGGGQLGMMLTEATKKFQSNISKVIVLDPTKDCPASLVGAEQIVADFKDKEAIRNLASKVDYLTYEIESGDSDALEEIKEITSINPSPSTLRTIQDKFLQKTFLAKNKIPVAEFDKIDDLNDLYKKISNFGYPTLLKARRDAYDGRGNFKLKSKNNIEQGFEFLEGRELMIEKFVDFKMEVSVIAARNTEGEISTFPVVENIHEENILRTTIAPARVSSKVAQMAQEVAHKTMDVLMGAGVFGIEMFVTRNENILINEIAPRVHNSGHHTLESSKTSQFEQHLRAITGQKLGDAKLEHPTIMYNILGPKTFEGPYKSIKDPKMEGVFLKMYQKKKSKPMRKMGHVNLVDVHNSEGLEGLFQKLENIKGDFILQPA